MTATVAFAIVLAGIVAGCATRDVAVLDARTNTLTLNGEPIEPFELIAEAQQHHYGQADLVVISTNGTETVDLRKTTEELAFWLFLPLLAPDFDGTNTLKTAPNMPSEATP